MKTITKNILVLSFLITNVIGWAQTNPTAFNLATAGNYSFTNWPSSSPAGSYPANMVFHHFTAMSAPLSTATAGSDVTGVYNSSSTTQTRMNGLDGGGFSFKNNNSTTDISGYTRRRLGEAVLALNTTDRTNIQVSWTAGEIGTVNNIVCAITCQYRVGTSGAYTTLPGTAQYLSSDPSASVNFGPITLPASCDNKPVVQIRWAYTFVSGTNSNPAPQLFVDQISVTSIPLVTISPIPNTCLIDPAFTLSDGLPAGGVYSGPGVTGGGTFTPSVAGAGTHTITYTYTDANNISNFTTTTVDVDMSYCIVESQLNSTSCGATGLAANAWIYCEPVFGATSYQFTVSNTSLGYSQSFTVNAPYTGVSLTKFPGILSSTTYDVVVRVMHTGVLSGPGQVCQITTASAPTTMLTTASCGATGLTKSSYIYCNQVSGATQYEWTFTNSQLGFSYVWFPSGPYRSCKLSNIPGLVAGETYNVTVRAMLGQLTPAGTSCQITLSSSFMNPYEGDSKTMEDEMTQTALIYPNPVSINSEINIQLNQVQTSNIIITDIMGRLVFQKQYANLDLISINLNELSITPGIYNIAVSNGESIENNKIVITK